ncbi:hypothetical protein ACHAXS_013989 [Conticribra weissflogii]
MMQQSDDDNKSHDLEFTTSVDSSIPQNVPVPPPPSSHPTNNVLSNMIQSPVTTTTQSSQQPSSYTPSAISFLNKSSHPTACLFHILFKGLGFTIYMMGSKFMEDIMVTVICILLLAADFWVVKNITGRLLVGLRWWNKVDPVTGMTNWIFESAASNSHNSNARNNSFDSRFFWSVLYLTPVLWTLCFLSAMFWFEFQCFVTLSCALVLSVSNVYGYYKCSADQREKLKQWMDSGAEFGVRAMVRNGTLGWILGRFSGGRDGGGRMQPVPQQDIMPGTFA